LHEAQSESGPKLEQKNYGSSRTKPFFSATFEGFIQHKVSKKPNICFCAFVNLLANMS
jgi:hypothetical protein